MTTIRTISEWNRSHGRVRIGIKLGLNIFLTDMGHPIYKKINCVLSLLTLIVLYEITHNILFFVEKYLDLLFRLHMTTPL